MQPFEYGGGVEQVPHTDQQIGLLGTVGDAADLHGEVVNHRVVDRRFGLEDFLDPLPQLHQAAGLEADEPDQVDSRGCLLGRGRFLGHGVLLVLVARDKLLPNQQNNIYNANVKCSQKLT
jgi:hypothetical protein